MNVESPNRRQVRIAFVLDNSTAGTQFRVSPNVPMGASHLRRTMSLVPAGETAWAYSERGGLLEFGSLAFDPNAMAERLETHSALDVFARPRLNFSNERIWNFGRRLVEESRNANAFAPLYCESLSISIVIEILRIDQAFMPRVQRGGLSWKQVKRVTDFIEDNLSARITLRDLAEVVGISQSHFSHAFKESTGKPPHRWQLEARIRRAKQLLLLEQMSLSEIATETGFADQSHLTRTFRRIVGTTPRAWQLRWK